MEKLRHDHLELVQMELEYFAARYIAEKKKKKVEATEAGPSTIDVSSSSSSKWESDSWNNFSSPHDEDWVISRCLGRVSMSIYPTIKVRVEVSNFSVEVSQFLSMIRVQVLNFRFLCIVKVEFECTEPIN
jgi:hypothetical protein